MNGHLAIAELRRQGRRPSIIFIDDLQVKPKMTIWDDAEQSMENDMHATIHIMPNEPVGRLNLMCIVGCTVAINGYHRGRINALVTRCKQFRPARVVASFENEFISG